MTDQKPTFSLWTSKQSLRNGIAAHDRDKTVTTEQIAEIRSAFMKKVDDDRLTSYNTVHNETALARLFG